MSNLFLRRCSTTRVQKPTGLVGLFFMLGLLLVMPNFGYGQSYTSCVDISYQPQPDPDGISEQACVTITAIVQTDLALNKTASDAAVAIGQTVEFTVSLINESQSYGASGLVVRDVLPSGFDYLSDSSDGSYDPATGFWQVGSLAAGERKELRIQARVLSNTGETAHTNIAQVYAMTESDADSTPNNGLASEDDQSAFRVQAVQPNPIPALDPIPQAPRLELQKRVLGGGDSDGDGLQEQIFEILVTNNGEAEGSYQLSDTATLLPAGVSLSEIISLTASSDGAYNPSDNLNLGGFDGGQDTALTLAAQAIAAGAQHRYVLHLEYAIDANTVDATLLACSEPDAEGLFASGQGAYNQAVLSAPKSVRLTQTQTATASGADLPSLDSFPVTAGHQRAVLVYLGFERDHQDLTTGDNFADPAWPTGQVQIEIAGPANTSLFAQAAAVTQTHAAPAGDTTLFSGELYQFQLSEADLQSLLGGQMGGSLSIRATGVNPGQSSADDSFIMAAAFEQVAQDGTLAVEAARYDSRNFDAPPNKGDFLLSVPSLNSGTEPNAPTDGVVVVALSFAGQEQGSFGYKTPFDYAHVAQLSSINPNGGYDLAQEPSGLSANMYFRHGPETDSLTSFALQSNAPALVPVANGQFLYHVLEGAAGETRRDACAPLSLSPPSDLALSLASQTLTPQVGDVVSIVLTLSNQADTDATGVSLSVTLPTGLAYVSHTSEGLYDPETGVWQLDRVGSGQTTQLALLARVQPADEPYLVLAEVTAMNESDLDSMTGSGVDTDGDGLVVGDADDEDDGDGLLFIPQANADLSLTQSLASTPVRVGDIARFTVTLNNAGPSAAQGIRVTNTLPAGYSFIGATSSLGSYSAGIWQLDSLAPSADATLDIEAQVLAMGPYTNTAQITASATPDPDSDPANPDPSEDDTTSLTPSVEPLIDLELDANVDRLNVQAGEQVTFTLALVNQGPSAASNLIVAAALPAGYSYDTHSGDGSYDPVTGSWSLASLAAEASASLSILVSITQQADPASYRFETELVSAGQTDLDSTPNSGVDSDGDGIIADDADDEDDGDGLVLRPGESVDLSLSLATSNGGLTPLVGSDVEFNLLLSNAGPQDASGLQVHALLPSGLSYVSHSGDGLYDSATGAWNLDSLAVGATVSLVLQTKVEASGSYDFVSEVVAQDQVDQDSVPNNKLDGEDDISRLALAPIAVADLSVQLTAVRQEVRVGDVLDFDLALANAGPSAAENIALSSLLPAGYSLQDAVASMGNYETVTGQWDLPGLEAGDSATLRLSALVLPDDGLYTLTANVIASGTYDPDSSPQSTDESEDDTASITPAVVSVIDLSLEADAQPAVAQLGDSVTLSFDVTNAGPSQASDVVASIPLPAGMAYVSDTGAYDSATGQWTIGTLAAGASARLSIDVVLQASNDPQAYRLEAEIISAAQFDVDSVPASGVDSDGDGVIADDAGDQDDGDGLVLRPGEIVDMSVSLDASTLTPGLASPITVIALAQNAGPQTATGLQFDFALPSGLVYSSHSGAGTYDEIRGVWNLASLPAGTEARLTVGAQVQSQGSYVLGLELMAQDQNDADSVPANNLASEDDQASLTLLPTDLADLSLVLSDISGAVRVGEEWRYRLALTNAGPAEAQNVAVRNLLPTGLALVSASTGVGSYVDGIWRVTSLAMGQTANLEVVVEALPLGEYTVSAEISASELSDPDSTPGNGLASEDDQASLTPAVIAVSDLELDVQTANTAVMVGDTVTIRVALANQGPSTATGVVVTTQWPEGLAYTGHTGAGQYDPATGLWSAATLGAGDVQTLSLTARVITPPTLQPNDPAAYRFTAEVTAADQEDLDSVPDDGVDTDGDGVVSDDVGDQDDGDGIVFRPGEIIDLSVAITASTATPLTGSEVEILLSVTNAGPQAATGLQLMSLLPAGLDQGPEQDWRAGLIYQSHSGTGNYDAGTGQWNPGSLAAGQSASLSIIAQVLSVGGPIDLGLEVSAHDQADVDSIPANGNASEDDQASLQIQALTPARFTLEKKASGLTDLGAGRYGMTYSLMVANLGGTTGVYDLYDTPQFAPGVIIESAHLALNGSVPQPLALSNQSPALLAQNQSLAADTQGSADLWQLSLVLDASALAEQSRLQTLTSCDASTATSTPVTAQGLLNSAQLLSDGQQQATAFVCPFGDNANSLLLSKRASAVSDHGDGVLSLSYEIQIDNLGTETVTYDLDDSFAIAPAFTITDVQWLSAPAQNGFAQDGLGLSSTGVTGTGITLPASSRHTYAFVLVVAHASQDANQALADAFACESLNPQAGQGLYNAVRVGNNQDAATPQSVAVACPLGSDGTGGLVLRQTAAGTVSLPESDPAQYLAGYRIEVTNTSGAMLRYDLVAAYAFDPNFAPVGAPGLVGPDGVSLQGGYTGQAVTRASGQAPLAGESDVLVLDQALAAGEIHGFDLGQGVVWQASDGTRGRDAISGCLAQTGALNEAAGLKVRTGLFGTNSVPTSSLATQAEACAYLAEVRLDIQASPAENAEIGDTITFRYVLSNIGSQDIPGLRLNQSLVGDLRCRAETSAGAAFDITQIGTGTIEISGLAAGDSIACTSIHLVTENDGAEVLNIISVSDLNSLTLSNTENVVIPVNILENSDGLELSKAITGVLDNDPATDGLSAGDSIIYSLVLTNTGLARLENVQISDPLLTLGDCVPSLGGGLEPGQRLSCEADYLITPGDVELGYVASIARATAVLSTEAGTETLTASDSTSLPLGDTSDAPTLSLLSLLSTNLDEDGSGTLTLGDTLQFEVSTFNTSNTNLNNLAITSNLVTDMPAECSLAVLAPFTGHTCQFEWVVTTAPNAAPLSALASRSLSRAAPTTVSALASRNLSRAAPTTATTQLSHTVSAQALWGDDQQMGLAVSSTDNALYSLGALDYGDLPDSYEGGDVNEAARHTPQAGMALGAIAPDAEAIKISTANALGDDLDGTDDEDAITTSLPLSVATQSYDLTINVLSTGSSCSGANSLTLVGWIDVNANGVFDTQEQSQAVLLPFGLDASPQTLTWPDLGAVGIAELTNAGYALRLRLYDGDMRASLSPTGAGGCGEVEDHILQASLPDYGDHPASYDGTNPAAHSIGGVYLGAVAPDGEASPQASSDASGDDQSDAGAGQVDDEDAIDPATVAPISPDLDSYSLSVMVGNVSAPGAIVLGCIDLDASGVFDANERSYTSVALGSTQANLTWTDMTSLAVGQDAYRLRLRVYEASERVDEGGYFDPQALLCDGPGGTGEVEDHLIPSLPPQSLVARKSAKEKDVGVGEFVTWNLEFENIATVPISGVQLVDALPAGLAYVPGTARMQRLGLDTAPIAVEPTLGANAQLSWSNLSFAAAGAPGHIVEISVLTRVGTLPTGSEIVNRAQAFSQSVAGYPLSNLAEARVRIRATGVFDCADVIGAVFNDLNANGYRDDGEPGLRGVSLYTVRGQKITVDSYGRYHVPCAQTPGPRGRNELLKLDVNTLPRGCMVSSENPRVVRVTPGKAVIANFGVACSQTVRVTLCDQVFQPGATEMSLAWRKQMEELVALVKSGPKQLIITHATGENATLGQQRLQRVILYLRNHADAAGYPLSVEAQLSSDLRLCR